jgi:heme iron utilization protein
VRRQQAEHHLSVDSQHLQLMASLLRERSVLTLGVVVAGAPVLGLLPFAVSPSQAALLVHASRLARHTRGLWTGAPASALIHAPDAPGVDPLQVPRLTLDVEVRLLERHAPAFSQERERYLARFPEAEITFTLGDFQLFALAIHAGRLVAGFGRAFDATKDQIVAALGPAGAIPG